MRNSIIKFLQNVRKIRFSTYCDSLCKVWFCGFFSFFSFYYYQPTVISGFDVNVVPWNQTWFIYMLSCSFVGGAGRTDKIVVICSFFMLERVIIKRLNFGLWKKQFVNFNNFIVYCSFWYYQSLEIQKTLGLVSI